MWINPVIWLVVGSPAPYKYREELNSKVSVWQGDITRLEIGAIANAANETLLGGGGGNRQFNNNKKHGRQKLKSYP